MYFKDILISALNKPLEDICISIDMGVAVYPISFIYDETDDKLIIESTGDDGYERLVVLNKKEILSVNVVYEQDFDKLFSESKEPRYYE